MKDRLTIPLIVARRRGRGLAGVQEPACSWWIRLNAYLVVQFGEVVRSIDDARSLLAVKIGL